MAPTEDLNPSHVCGVSWRLTESEHGGGGRDTEPDWTFLRNPQNQTCHEENKTDLDLDAMLLTFMSLSIIP